MAPMSLRLNAQEGSVSEKLINFWEARAKGGVGLIITDVLTVDPNYCYLGPTLSLGTEESMVSMKRLTDTVHKYGAKIIPQLSHPGPDSLRGLLSRQEVVGPSQLVNKSTGTICRELSIAEIESIIEMFGDTAKKAREVGFDGVEFHSAHAYMLGGSFLSPVRNKRTDKYGGSLECRLRFALEAIENIRRKAGNDFPIVVRMSGDELIEDGNHLYDMICAARAFEQAGVSALEISGGVQPEYAHHIIPCMGKNRALNAAQAAEIKKAVKIPVFCVGKIHTPMLAESLIETGKIDMVVMGRALLSDPELPNKSMVGDIDNIAPCIGCGDGCIGSGAVLHSTCSINPMVGEEKEMEIIPVETPKNVVVIGGGPGGMMAARDCALRGHKVTLVEKEAKLGGRLNVASRGPFKQDITGWVKYLINQVEGLDIKIITGKECDEAMLKELAPEAIVVATGGCPIVPNIEGIDGPNIVMAMDVLEGKLPILRGNILIIGGGIVGLETADFLKQNVNSVSVTVLEMLDDVGREYIPATKSFILNKLMGKGVKIHTLAKVEKINENGVIANVRGEEKNFGTFDYIVVACGFKGSCSDGVYEGLAKDIYVIGDALKPRRALEAIAEGAKTARAI
ncbi:FAD-dependent oxidoreductase [Phosphitispora sp. TUW77]|uniref:oxidoreductase n=1 Tax=Phosphitispora sp. TUW77 TaxID=3152361 RepID=UPI003AB23DAA